MLFWALSHSYWPQVCPYKVVNRAWLDHLCRYAYMMLDHCFEHEC